MTTPPVANSAAVRYLTAVGRKIREQRLARRLRQRDVADAAGIDYRHYQKIEAGTVNLRIQTLFDIAHHLDMPLCLLSCPMTTAADVGASCSGCEFHPETRQGCHPI